MLKTAYQGEDILVVYKAIYPYSRQPVKDLEVYLVSVKDDNDTELLSEEIKLEWNQQERGYSCVYRVPVDVSGNLTFTVETKGVVKSIQKSKIRVVSR